MGVLRPIVEFAHRDKPQEREPSKRILTPATGVSATRPALGAKAGEKLIKGEKGALPYVAAMAITDGLDGWTATLFDKLFPDSGLGRSEFGAKADQYADSVAVLEVTVATLLAPRVSWLGKAAVATVLAQEGHKIQWAVRSAKDYYAQTGELLDIPTEPEGQESMAEKLVAACAAVATGETDNRLYRASFGALAMGFASAGSLRGERVRRHYNEVFVDLMTQMTDQQAA